MIQYEQFDFAAPPMHAGQWFIESAKDAGLKRVGLIGNPTLSFRAGTRFRVSLVQHPCQWLVNVYSYIKNGETTWALKDMPLYWLNTFSLESFVLDYLKQSPGCIGDMFDRYKADSCIRVEDLPWAFVDLVESLDIQLTRDQLSSITSRPIVPCVDKTGVGYSSMTRELHHRVIDAERGFVERYDYF